MSKLDKKIQDLQNSLTASVVDVDKYLKDKIKNLQDWNSIKITLKNGAWEIEIEKKWDRYILFNENWNPIVDLKYKKVLEILETKQIDANSIVAKMSSERWDNMKKELEELFKDNTETIWDFTYAKNAKLPKVDGKTYVLAKGQDGKYYAIENDNGTLKTSEKIKFKKFAAENGIELNWKTFKINVDLQKLAFVKWPLNWMLKDLKSSIEEIWNTTGWWKKAGMTLKTIITPQRMSLRKRLPCRKNGKKR